MSLPSEDECGMRTFDSRLFGGEDAGIGSWPWVASIGYRVRGRQDLVWGCGAALITSRHALTAAHCINGLSSNQTPEKVRLGELDFRRDPDCLPSDPSVCADRPLDAPIIGLVSHPGFRGRRNNAFADDIGIITLGLSVRSTDFIRPICLPLDLLQLSGGTDGAEGQQAYIAGWGRSETSTFFTPALQEARILMRSGSVCETTYRRDITAGLGRRLCAGTGDGVDTCRGDSGGPLMVPSPSGSNWYLTGITSFGSNQCGSNPAVYTRVHDYLDWIRNNLQVDL